MRAGSIHFGFAILDCGSGTNPTFNDLREELPNRRDEERLGRIIDEAKLAAIKLIKLAV